jgi:hypothetical protein
MKYHEGKFTCGQTDRRKSHNIANRIIFQLFLAEAQTEENKVNKSYLYS